MHTRTNRQFLTSYISLLLAIILRTSYKTTPWELATHKTAVCCRQWQRSYCSAERDSYRMWASSTTDSDSKQYTTTQQQHCTDSNDTVLDYLCQIQHVYHLRLEFVASLFTNNDVLYNDAHRHRHTDSLLDMFQKHTVAAMSTLTTSKTTRTSKYYNPNMTACNNVNCINLQMHASSMSWCIHARVLRMSVFFGHGSAHLERTTIRC